MVVAGGLDKQAAHGRGALVRVEMPLAQGESVEQVQKEMDEFVAQVKRAADQYIPR